MPRIQRSFAVAVSLLVALPWLFILLELPTPALLEGRYVRLALTQALFGALLLAGWLMHRRRGEPLSARTLGLLGYALFALLGAQYGDYQADDAAISWAFADRFAAGQGFALNPEDGPVEGFSNPSLVAYLIFTHWLGVPILAASKLLGLVTGLGTLWLSQRLMREQLAVSPRAAALALWWMAACTPFVFWGIAGLENPLLALLLVAAVYLGARELERPERRPWGSALLLFAVSQTRPEGLGYVLLFGLARLLYARTHERSSRSGSWLAIALLPLLPVELLRVGYFGAPLPNTFYAKVRELSGAASLLHAHAEPALHYLIDWLSGYGLALGGLFALVGLLEWRAPAKVPPALWLLSALLLAALGFIFVSGGDFYPAARFLSHAVPLAVMLGVRGAESVFAGLRARSSPEVARGLDLASLAGAGLLCLHLLVNLPAPLSGLGETSVPFQRIADRGQHFAALARIARIARPSLLDADLGGTSYRTGLAIIDLAGLGDREVARAMREHRYGPEFIQHYVFERRKPTFIHYHEPWSSMSGIERTPGLARDYLPIAAVSYRPLLKTEQAALPSERNYVRIEAVSDASLGRMLPQLQLGGVELLALEARPDCMRVVFRLANALAAGTRARFVVDERDEQPLLYGWTAVEQLRPGVPFVQFVPAHPGQALSLAVDGERVLIPSRATAHVH